MNLTYLKGFIPQCITLISGYNPIWDKTTYYSFSPFTGDFDFKVSMPSFATTGFIPVIGPGTPFPLKVNLSQLGEIFWNTSGLIYNIESIVTKNTFSDVFQCFQGEPPISVDKTLTSTFEGNYSNTFSSKDNFIYSSLSGTSRKNLICGNTLSLSQRFGIDAADAVQVTSEGCNETFTSTENGEISNFEIRFFFPITSQGFTGNIPSVILYNNFYYPAFYSNILWFGGGALSASSYLNTGIFSVPLKLKIQPTSLKLLNSTIEFDSFIQIFKDEEIGNSSSKYEGTINYNLEIIPWSGNVA